MMTVLSATRIRVGRATLRAGPAILAVLLLCAAPALGAQEEEVFRWSGTVEAGDRIEVEGINGFIHAEPGTGREVEVVARKHGEDDDPSSVQIEVIEHEDGVTLCALYPTPEGKPRNRCAPGGEGRMNNGRNDVEVDFTVRVPSGVDFHGATVNGEVVAEGLSGRTVARTVNGSVRVSTAGVARAETVNGSIEARLGSADWDGTLDFETVNGAITVYLPDGVDADVSAETVNGSLETQFPLTVRGRWGPKEMRGTLGSGGRGLKLETVNGSIHLLRG